MYLTELSQTSYEDLIIDLYTDIGTKNESEGNNMKKLVCMVLAAMMLLSGVAFAEGKLSIQGSTSVTPLMEKLVAAFPDKSVECEVQGTGSSAGIKAAIEGTADLGMSSRNLKEAELAELTPIIIAMDGIAVVVNPENPVKSLTKEQVSQVFKGEIVNWKDLGGEDAPIVLISREAGSGTRDAFEELMELTTEKDGKKLSLVDFAYPIVASGNGEVKQNVATKKGAIGYLSLGSVDDTLVAAKIDDVEATPENIKNNTYAIARPFIVVTKGAPRADVQALIDFILGAEGQQIVADNHYITMG